MPLVFHFTLISLDLRFHTSAARFTGPYEFVNSIKVVVIILTSYLSKFGNGMSTALHTINILNVPSR
jgi:hypothetical protein